MSSLEKKRLSKTYERLKYYLDILRKELQQEKQQIVKNRIRSQICLMGNTKAGKTTLYYYMGGKELERTQDQCGLSLYEPVNPERLAIIGNTKQSQTIYPNFNIFQGTLIADTPGFLESRDSFKLVNLYIIQQLIQMKLQKHFVLVLSIQTLSNPIEIIQCTYKFLSIFAQKMQQEIVKYCSIILTKINENHIDEFKSFLQDITSEEDILNEAEIKIKQKTKNAIRIFFQEIYDKFDDKVFCFYDQKVDRIDTEKGIELTKKILEKQFLDTEHIEYSIINQNCVQSLGQEDSPRFRSIIIKVLNVAYKYTAQFTKLISCLLKISVAIQQSNKHMYMEQQTKLLECLKPLQATLGYKLLSEQQYQISAQSQSDEKEFNGCHRSQNLQLTEQSRKISFEPKKYSNMAKKSPNENYKIDLCQAIDECKQTIRSQSLSQFVKSLQNILKFQLYNHKELRKKIQQNLQLLKLIIQLAESSRDLQIKHNENLQQQFEFIKLDAMKEEIKHQINQVLHKKFLNRGEQQQSTYNTDYVQQTFKNDQITQISTIDIPYTPQIELQKLVKQQSLKKIKKSRYLHQQISEHFSKIFLDWQTEKNKIKFQTNFRYLQQMALTPELEQRNQYLREAAKDLKKISLFEQSIIFLALAQDYESISAELDYYFEEHFQQYLSAKFINYLAEYFSKILRDELSIKCFNHLLAIKTDIDSLKQVQQKMVSYLYMDHQKRIYKYDLFTKNQQNNPYKKMHFLQHMQLEPARIIMKVEEFEEEIIGLINKQFQKNRVIKQVMKNQKKDEGISKIQQQSQHPISKEKIQTKYS